jgi:hypothetical protein
MRLATYLHVITMLRISGIVPLIFVGAFKACTGWSDLVSSRFVTGSLSIGLVGPVELRRFGLDYLLVCSDTVWPLQTSSIICVRCIHYRPYRDSCYVEGLL